MRYGRPQCYIYVCMNVSFVGWNQISEAIWLKNENGSEFKISDYAKIKGTYEIFIIFK